MDNTVVECINISKNYALENNAEGVNALKNISFELKEGDRLGLVGLNGSGKSTLLKILSGMIKPSEGKIIINKNIKNLSGFDSLLHAELSGKENILFQLKLIGFNKSETAEALREVIEFSELGEAIHQPVRTYSSGMMLRLSFSIFKVVQPEILLLDEVLSAGDMKFQKKVDTLMKYHLKNVSAIIMASHQLIEIKGYCNKCLVLNKGEIEFFGGVDEAINLYLTNKEDEFNEHPHIKLLESKFCKGREVFLNTEYIELEFSYLKKSDQTTDIMVYIRSNYENLMTDSPLYRSSFDNQKKQKQGVYNVKISIPKNLFNKGRYHIDLVFGDGIKEIFIKKNALSFSIELEDWEKDKLWNRQAIFPLRPFFNWEVFHQE